jgi:sugar lactone lactonase YvrE
VIAAIIAPTVRRMTALGACLIGVLALTANAQASVQVRVFAHVPAPGYPADALVAADGTVYAGSFKSFTTPADTGPSKVFAFSPAGALERTYTITGQTPGAAHGVQVAATDRAGTLYLLDQSPPRVLKLDPRTGAQSSWATFSTVPICKGALRSDCTYGPSGTGPEPDFATWGPDGSLYVTDYNQDLIWRVPPGGGKATVWFTDPRLNGLIVGPAGIQLLADGHTLMFDTGAGGSNLLAGKLYTLPILANGQPGPLHQIWQSALVAAPDGFAIARSGNVYISLVGPTANAVVEISPQGRQLAMIPANPIANMLLALPFDAPGSIRFDGNQILVTNESSLLNDPAHWALLEINVSEPGLPLPLPPAAPTRPRHRPAGKRQHHHHHRRP